MGETLPPVDPGDDPGGNVVTLATELSGERTRRAESLQARLRTFRELNELPDTEHEQMLGELLVRGHRLLIGADSGHGKSTMVNDMIRCLATGELFLESKHFDGITPGRRSDGSPYTVLVIDCEQSDRTVKRRLRDAGIQDIEYCHYWLIPEGLDISSPTKVDYQVIEAALAELRPDVVVIDPLFKLHRGDPNSSELAAQVMSAVDHWRATYNFGLVIPVHVRKIPTAQGNARKISLSDVYGAGTWTWGAEVVVGLERHRDPTTGRQKSTLRWLKCRDDATMFEQAWEMVLTAGGVFRRLLAQDATAPSGNKNEAKNKAKDLMRNLLMESGRRFTTTELWQETHQATGLDQQTTAGIITQWWSVSPRNPKCGNPADDAVPLDRRKANGRIEYWWGPAIVGDDIPGLRFPKPPTGKVVASEDPFGLEADMVEDILSGGSPDDDDMED